MEAGSCRGSLWEVVPARAAEVFVERRHLHFALCILAEFDVEVEVGEVRSWVVSVVRSLAELLVEGAAAPVRTTRRTCGDHTEAGHNPRSYADGSVAARKLVVAAHIGCVTLPAAEVVVVVQRHKHSSLAALAALGLWEAEPDMTAADTEAEVAASKFAVA